MAMGEEQNSTLRAVAQAYAERLKIFTLEDGLPCGVKALAAYGHTPGHTIYKIGDALIVGDIMHGVALQLDHPQYCARFDADHDQSVRVRKEILQMGKDEGLTLYGMHFPSPYFIR
jgi:glyoxylase-like metal-dependent hydrolase (beta-lactamase superfamily II)